MANLISLGEAFAAERQKTAAGVSVVYHQGAGEVSLTAVPGSSEHEQVDYDGTAVVSQSVDFLIDPADLVIATVNIKPKNGDTIVSSHTGSEKTYEVSSEFGVHHYEPSGTHGSRWRIHTKQVS